MRRSSCSQGIVSASLRGFALIVAILLSVAASRAAATGGGGVANPWVTSDALVYDQPVPNTWSIATFHASPALAGLAPKDFCRKVFDIYYDGRKKNFKDSQVGMTLWSHLKQEPRVNDGLIEFDPILLLNVHGSGYCGIQSGLLEGIYQSRPGGQPGKPAIDARRWFLAGIIHSVTDAYYDGRWHYFDIDLGGYGGDPQKDVWSVADVLADPKGYYGDKTTIRSRYFFDKDGKGAWVDKIDKAKSYTFGDNHMLGHEMSFRLRPGEKLTRYFNKAAAGWAEMVGPTTNADEKMKGFYEIVFEPKDAAAALASALWAEGDAAIYAVRSPYNIGSSRVQATGKVSVSTDLGRTFKPLAADGLVADVVNGFDYLLKIEGGALQKVTTRGMLHPAALPRVGAKETKMTVASMAEYDVLTWIPDWSTPEGVAATAKVEGLAHKVEPKVCFSGGSLTGTGSVTVPVRAPAGCKLVKVSACVIGRAGNPPDPKKWMELHLGPAGKTALVERTTDCTEWGLKPETKIDHWQSNVNGAIALEPCAEAEVKVVCQGWGQVRGMRIWATYVREKPAAPSGTLSITHGFDGKTFVAEVVAADLAKGPVAYTVPGGATRNEFITMTLRDGAPGAGGAVVAGPAPAASATPAPPAAPTPTPAPPAAVPAVAPATAPAAVPATAAANDPAAGKVVKEDWDWATAMIAVAKKGREGNREGVVLSLGDSLTYANQSTRWARNPQGGTAEDKAVLQWSHAGKKDDSDGWHLASVDAPGGGRSETAATGIRADQYIAGGKGLRPLKEIIAAYKPQVAFVLLGANDCHSNRKPDDVAKDMATILDALLDNGTIPVLQLVPPRAAEAKNELVRQYNERYVALARERKIPIIDLYGEFTTRAPAGAWKTQLLNKDGIHFSPELAGGPPTEENLARSGYLLRCWLSVQKLKDVKSKVIDQVK